MGFSDDLRALDLLADGLEGEAVVTGLRGPAEGPEVDLQVRVGARHAYAVTLRPGPRPEGAPPLRPGATVRVRVDPRDPQAVLLA